MNTNTPRKAWQSELGHAIEPLPNPQEAAGDGELSLTHSCRTQQADLRQQATLTDASRGFVLTVRNREANQARPGHMQPLTSDSYGEAEFWREQRDRPYRAGSSTARSGHSGQCPPSAPQTVGTVPPSITYSVPVIEAARGETRKAIRSATSFGFAGRPSGMPPKPFMMICLPPS